MKFYFELREFNHKRIYMATIGYSRSMDNMISVRWPWMYKKFRKPFRNYYNIILNYFLANE